MLVILFQIIFFILTLFFAFAAIGEQDSRRQKSFTEILIVLVISSAMLMIFGG